MADINHEILVGHLCCGSGFGAKGFRKGNARVGNLTASFRNIGGIDIDPAGIRDFERFAGVNGTVLDLMSREQFIQFHGHEPPEGWHEATPADIHRAMGYERPNIWFISAPCKGFSGLLSKTSSMTPKYQALNALTLRCVWLALEAFKDDPVEMFLFENVPLIMTRGRALLDRIQALFTAYGYAWAETTHDCGELGGLAQSRKRFLMVGRHKEKVPTFVYEPPKRSLRAVGDVLGRLPMPCDPVAGPMHRLPRLQWKTWVRLALVEAGSDWRSLNRLAVEDGFLKDFGIVPDETWNGGVLGVKRWEDTSGTVAARSGPTNGAYSVADPRSGGQFNGQGKYRVTAFEEPAGSVIGASTTGQGAFAVADIRPPKGAAEYHQYGVRRWGDTCGAVINVKSPGQGVFSVADPRPEAFKDGRSHYKTQGHYGVVKWGDWSGAVPAHAKHDRGTWSVADPRAGSSIDDARPGSGLPAQDERLVAHITALDGTYHRPFTTLELAALQSLFDPDEWFGFGLDGTSDSAWRERIGNGVPPEAAEAIAGVMGRTLLLAWSGETFLLSNDPIWVQPLTVGLAVDLPDMEVGA